MSGQYFAVPSKVGQQILICSGQFKKLPCTVTRPSSNARLHCLETACKMIGAPSMCFSSPSSHSACASCARPATCAKRGYHPGARAKALSWGVPSMFVHASHIRCFKLKHMARIRVQNVNRSDRSTTYLMYNAGCATTRDSMSSVCRHWRNTLDEKSRAGNCDIGDIGIYVHQAC
eukprot:1146522-Pelagomonas_calceolata.AAC.8